MQQHQIHIFKPQLLQRSLHTGIGGILTIVVQPDLRGDEQFAAVDPAATDTLTYGRLVEVSLCGIDMAVADFNSLSHRVSSLLGWNLENSETLSGDGTTVRHGQRVKHDTLPLQSMNGT